MNQKMTQKETIIKVLNELGGKAFLEDIYPRVIKIARFKYGSDKEATIRATMLRNPSIFKKVEGVSGLWELVSYQEEISVRDKQIAELKAQLATKEDEIKQLKQVKTEDDFIVKFINKVKQHLKRDKKTVEEIRKLMDALGRSDAERELDAWIDCTEKGDKNNAPVTVAGDYVVQKHVDSEVGYVSTGGTGIKTNAK